MENDRDWSIVDLSSRYERWRRFRAVYPFFFSAVAIYGIVRLIVVDRVTGFGVLLAELSRAGHFAVIVVCDAALVVLAGLGYAVYAVLVARIQAAVGRAAAPRGSSVDANTPELVRMARNLKISGQDAEIYLAAAATPARIFQRVSEEIEQTARATRTQATFTVRLPHDWGRVRRDGHAVIPLFWVNRGIIEDGLRVHSNGGPRVSTLTSRESAAYFLAVVAYAAGVARSRRKARRFWEGSNAPAMQIANYFLDGARGAFAATYGPEVRVDQLISVLNSLDLKDQSLDYRIVWMLDRALDDYPICVRTPGGARALDPRTPGVRVVVERRVLALVPGSAETVDLGSDVPGTWRGRVRRRLGRARAWLSNVWDARPATRSPGVSWGQSVVAMGRAFARPLVVFVRVWYPEIKLRFGVTSPAYEYPLLLAETTSSYHLSIAGPDNGYLARQSISGWPESDRGAAKVTVAPIGGQRFAHIYVADGSGGSFAQARFTATFYERPPGSIRKSLWVAAAGVVVALVAATIQLRAPANGSEVVGLTQVLLAVPIALAATPAFVGPSSIWGGVLVARLVTGATIVVGLAAIVVASRPSWLSATALPQVWSAIVLVLVALALTAFVNDRARVTLHRAALRNAPVTTKGGG